MALTGLLPACGTITGSNLEPLDRSTVLIEHDHGHGTGFIVGPHEVLTAYHVVQHEPLTVTFFQGPALDGRVSWSDRELDLALVEVEVPAGYPVRKLACDEPQVGEQLISIGHPTQSRWVATGGYLPTTARFGGVGLMSLGFPVGLGTSGGPVFDASGRVVGVTLAILAERNPASAGFDRYKDTGIGLMRPAADFCDALKDH
ncbi:MAG: S1 family peptidase [Geminicoccaceae bacterium]